MFNGLLSVCIIRGTNSCVQTLDIKQFSKDLIYSATLLIGHTSTHILTLAFPSNREFDVIRYQMTSVAISQCRYYGTAGSDVNLYGYNYFKLAGSS